MTARDRMVLLVVAGLALLAGFWFAVLGPRRADAAAAAEAVAAAQQRLDTARQSAATAQAARARYASDYATVARLGKAVPVQDDVPTLLYQLETAATKHKIDFRSLKVQAGGATPAAAAAPAAAAVASANGTQPASTDPSAASAAVAATLPPGASVGAAGFPVMPFNFAFDGGFFGMQKFLDDLNEMTKVQGPDKIDVTGRLLTIDGFSLQASRDGFPKVRANVSATAYLLPADQGLTAGATAQAPGDPSAPAAPATPGATGAPSSAPTTSATATSIAGRGR